VDDTVHDAVTLEPTQLLREHLLRDVRDPAFQIRKAPHVPAEEPKKN